MKIDQLEKILPQIYGHDKNVLITQLTRYKDLTNQFTELFGQADHHYFSTPGRTEIGGNHTDHNNGRVLAGSVNLDSIAVAAPTGTDQVTIYSRGFSEPFRLRLSVLDPRKEEEGTTTSLIRGIAARLAETGYKVGGFNACITSDVLPGSGLSSSASIEVLIGTIFSALFNDYSIPTETLAITGQYAENNYFGKPCGLMDQVACATGGIVTIDFKTPGKPIIKKVNFDFEAQHHNLVVVDTGGNHADLTSDYAAVPAEMKSVAKELGKSVCREITPEELMNQVRELRDKTGDRAILRAMHFIGDNERVLSQVDALENNDFNRFLELVKASGNSSFKWLQNIYTTKNVSEQGVSLALALTEKYISGINAGACRVHGGGFAGTIQVFLPSTAVKDYASLMESVFGKKSVLVLKIRPHGTVYLNRLNS